MTVSTTINRRDYLGNGTAGPFSYNFRIFSASHLHVYVDGVLKTMSTHYTVSGVGSPTGGNVTFTAGNEPAVGATILLLRIVPVTQLSDYINHDSFNAETLEADLDKTVMIAQQFLELTERIVKLPVDSTITGLTLPEAVSGGELIRWKTDKSGLELVNVSPPAGLNVITTQGDIIQGGAGGTPERLPIGSSGQIPRVSGGKLVYSNEVTVLTTQGDILFRNATGLARLPAGTSGQVLRTQGAGANPVWAGSIRRIVFPASCFETRDPGTSGWAEFVQLQGTNFDFGELRYDAAGERAFAPPFRLTNWNGGTVTVRIGFKTNATSGSVTWRASFLSIAEGQAWDAALTTNNFSAKSVGSVAENYLEAELSGVLSGLTNNNAVIMSIVRIDTPGPGIARLLFVELTYTEA